MGEPNSGESVPNLWGGEVAAVDPDDLRRAWEMTHEVHGRNQGQGAALDIMSYRRISSPSADVMALWFRVSMLALLQKMPESPLTQWTHDGNLDHAVFQVAATFPMKNPKVGTVYDGPQFEVPEFLRQIGRVKEQQK
jgi:hypothetical protein